jgi:hypothetical protein
VFNDEEITTDVLATSSWYKEIGVSQSGSRTDSVLADIYKARGRYVNKIQRNLL